MIKAANLVALIIFYCKKGDASQTNEIEQIILSLLISKKSAIIFKVNKNF